MNLDNEATEKLIKLIAHSLNMGSTVDMIHDALVEHMFPEHDIYLLIQAGSMLLKYRKDLDLNKDNISPIFRRAK